MPDLLFVYGSLRSEFDNPAARRLRAETEFAGAATVAGSIFLWGPFPGYRPASTGIVQGEIYRLNDPDGTLAHLDEYEGNDYRRIKLQLLSPETEAWIYEYVGDLSTSPRIVSGDFTRL